MPPFTVRRRDERLSPLRFALADLLTTDLARSAQLTLVERTRLGDVLRELELAGGRRVDSATAPRVGRLVSARRLVLGGLDELPGGSGLRIGVRLADVERGSIDQTIDAAAPWPTFWPPKRRWCPIGSSLGAAGVSAPVRYLASTGERVSFPVKRTVCSQTWWGWWISAET